MTSILFAFIFVLCSLHPLYGTVEFSPQVFDFSVNKYLVVPIYVLGLANRLRTMSSMYTIAKVTNRQLVVIWVPNVDCNIGGYAWFSVSFYQNAMHIFFVNIGVDRLGRVRQPVC